MDGDTGNGVSVPPCSLFNFSRQWDVSKITWLKATESTPWSDTDPDAKFFSELLNDTVRNPGGGDHFAEPIATTQKAVPEAWEEYIITEAMKKIIKNKDGWYGFYLKPYMNNTGRYYYASEHSQQAKRPKLTITYAGTSITTPLQVRNRDILVQCASVAGYLHVRVSSKADFELSIYSMNGAHRAEVRGTGDNRYQFASSVIGSGLFIIQVKTRQSTLYSTILSIH